MPGSTGIRQPVVAHACEYETSLMLEVRGDLVQMDRIKKQQPAIANEWFHSEDDTGKNVTLFHRFHRITAAGPLGDPSSATKEKGTKLREAVVAEVTRFVADFATWPMSKVLGPK
jgi:creatinine amidohydrolase